MSEILKIIKQEIKKELTNVNDNIGKSDVSDNLKIIKSLNKLLLNPVKIDFLNEKYHILNEKNMYKDNKSKFDNIIKYYTKRNFFSDSYINSIKEDLLVSLEMVSRIKITNLNEEEIIKFKDIISRYIHLNLILKYFNSDVDLEDDKLNYTVNKYNILEFISNENDINTVHSKLYIDEKILKNLKKFDFICAIDSNLFYNLDFLYNYMNAKKREKKEISNSKKELLLEIRIKESVIF